MVYRNFRRYNDFYYDLGNLGARTINLWNKSPSISIKSDITSHNNILYCEIYSETEPKGSKVLTFSEAKKKLKNYARKMEIEVKKRNERDYEELET